MYDLDGALGNFGVNVNTNYIEAALNPSEFTFHSALLNALLENTTFRYYFINRYADLINSIFRPYRFQPIAGGMATDLVEVMPRHINRWGAPFNYNYWLNSINVMLNFLEARMQIGRNHIQQSFSLAEQIDVTLEVEPAGAGKIKINTIYNDSNPWTGVYFKGVPIQITAIPNPGYSFSHWDLNDHLTALEESTQLVDLLSDDVYTAHFTGQVGEADVIVSEINYHSHDDYDYGDWIELHNRSNYDISLADWTFRDEAYYHSFTIPIEAVIPANGHLILCEDKEKFETIHPAVNNVYGNFDFGLSNGGDELHVRDAEGSVIFSMAYADASPWPEEADGEGYTLELFDPSTNDYGPDQWVAECFLGTPGGPYNSDCIIILSEQSIGLVPEALNIYPNPANQKVFIELGEDICCADEGIVRIDLFDISGQLIKSEEVQHTSLVELSIAGIRPGFYTIRWQSKTKLASGILIIQ